ncbi:MAG: type I methionyl aminopeptidase [Planctomycetes bacterium]|nr:type I methionyl aminopeptidase [Planctomycetota bacterium]
MIEIKSSREIQKIRDAGRVVAQVLDEVGGRIKPGVTTEELDHFIRDFVRARNGTLLFYNYEGFPAHSCISINEEVVHGIPSSKRRLREGDIVSIDVGVGLEGYCGDGAVTFPVGKISPEAENLLKICLDALALGIAAAVPRHRVSDISRAIQLFVEKNGYAVVKKYVGHGIGRNMHEPPQIPNYVDQGFLKEDPILREGMVLAIEPMVNAGTDDVVTLSDKWTVVTKDRKLSAHFEHTVAVMAAGPMILTLP